MTQVLDRPVKKEVKFKDDPLFSVIVPIYNIREEVLKRCLLSIEDQDYENLEVVLVLDGPDKKLRKVAEHFLEKNTSWKLVEIPHGGACAARNAGFKASKGEVVSFTNSDYILKPGVIRLWVDALLSHPECGFAYGGYEYSTEQRWWYPSKDFDPWLLEVANYIDCGFPLWRKYVVDWDVNCKSLQDWDFWLRVVKTHKIKGHYLGRDISFVAEPPRPKGLSDDSHNNWRDRVNYVKKNNGIPIRDIVVTSIGAPNHGIEIAKMIGADYRDDTVMKPNDYKALYMIGFFMRPDQQTNEHAKILAYYPKEVKKIIHFIGADIYWLRKFPYESLKYIAGALKEGADRVLSETKEAQEELLSYGIESEVVPIPSYNNWEVRPLPKEFSVATFFTNKSDFDKYLYEHTMSIVRAMPDVKFVGYGDAGKDDKYPNYEWRGNMSREEWKEFVYQNSCLLRLCRHDTLPMAGCEFMMAGRDVVTNMKMPHAYHIDTSGKETLNSWDKFAPGFNAHNWPDTKKKIVQTIRRIKSKSIDERSRSFISDSYKVLLDRKQYIKKIRELCHV